MRDEEKIPEGVRILAGVYGLSNIPMEPFSDIVIDFLSELSVKIRGLSRGITTEEMHALGFWLRRAHLLEMKEKYMRPDALGEGITFHIAPSNVPLMFAYTGSIGLLAGNSCRVRVSARRTADCDFLCGLINELLFEERFAGLQDRISILTYDRELTEPTRIFSLECDARVIWGGDETVNEIRKIPLRPTAVELVFPDRTSLAVLDAGAVAALSDDELETLAARFYNDTYAMDQNACSCPEKVFWKEDSADTGRLASDRFWNAVYKASERYALSEIKVSQKYGTLWECAQADAGVSHVRRLSNRLYVLELNDACGGLSDQRMQFGSFLEYHMKNGDEWMKAVSERTQTVICFGVDTSALRDTALQHRLRGVYRIVPVGQALSMDLTWDGKDLIECLTQKICG